MVAPVAPTLPVVLSNDEGETTIASTPREYWQAIYEGFFILGSVPPTPRDQIRATLADLDATKNPAISVAYNGDGTVSSVTEDGIATTYTYNTDGTVASQTRQGVTRTFTYTNGNLTGVA